MVLEIRNPNKLDLDGFVEAFLIPTLQEEFPSIIDNKRLIPIQEYIDKLNLSPVGKYKVRIKDVLISAMYNLVSTQLPSKDYIISIDSSQLVPNTSAKIIDLVQLVTYGSLLTPAYPVIEEFFSYYASRLDSMYTEYITGGAV